MPFSKIKVVTLFIFSLLITSFFRPKISEAQTILFQDNFNSGLSSDWQVIGGAWTTNVDPLYPSYDKWLVASAPRASDYEIQIGDFLWSNYQLEFDILPKSGIDRNIFFRVNDLRTSILSDHNLPVSYSLQLTSGLSYLGKWTVTSMPPLPISTYSIPSDSVSHIIIRIEEANIKVNVNGNQILNYTDINSPILNGRVSFAVITGADPSEVWYDNVVITDLTTPTESPTPTPTPSPTPTPIPFPSLNVPDVKQYDPIWKDETYDTATRWSSTPTIERWGCALTSATMILNYYGYNVTPDSLNTWLKNQSDGYLRNGLVNWLAISRYSKQNSEDILPDLEYKRLGNTQDILINELESGRPAILQEPGHFVVAKSQTDTSFGINDPGYSTRVDLSSYSNTFSAIGSYIPTHTDLSYIMLTTNKDSSITIFDSFGNQVNSAITYLQEPLSEDPDNINTSGETLKVLLLPKPDLDRYSVHVSNGQNPLNLDVYAYDNEGNLIGNEPEKINTRGSVIFQLNYDSDPTTPLIDNPLPSIPIHISPENNSFHKTTTLTTIDWENSTGTNGPIKYIYQSSNFPSLNFDGSFSSPVYTSAALADSQISTLGTPPGIYFWHIKAIDSLGNESAWSEPWMVTVDNTAPTISLDISPTPNSIGWNNSDTAIIWTVSDPESPIIFKSGCDSTTVNTETAGIVLTCSASSAGGTTSKSVTVKLDKTAPKITINKPLSNAKYVLNAGVMASWSITDSLSKLKGTKTAKTSSRSLLDTSYVGKHTFSLKAKDSADNLTTVNLDYYVNYAFKFISPKTIIRKEFLAIPSIPVKFKLNDAQGRFLPYVQTKAWIAETKISLFGGINLLGNEYEYILPTRLLPVTKNASFNVVISLDDGFSYTQKIVLK